ncbi:hypothetical protein O6P43_005475 [Quillaja saponaria]|uniref:Uncharacterized protein n=1 Tax=Quillaja saponaria TaxID=32244 RepID=A0AAD7Q657_QUISA|nr:hypothetical protein O6P43_005475 [Quillaja saponaria]
MGIEENFEATENLVVNTMEVKREEVKTELWSNSSPGNVAEDNGGDLNSGIMMGNENSGICVEFYANLDSECVVEGVSLEIEADSYLNIGGTKEEDKQLVDVVEEGTKLKEENVGEENNMDINVEEYLNLDNEGVMEDENAQVVRDNWEMNGEGIEDEERLVTGEKKQLTPNSESIAEDKSLGAYLENLAVVSAEKISVEEEASAAVMNDMKGNAHLDNIASIKEDDIEKERKRGMKVMCKKMKVKKSY